MIVRATLFDAADHLRGHAAIDWAMRWRFPFRGMGTIRQAIAILRQLDDG
jgi:hypothetical protein